MKATEPEWVKTCSKEEVVAAYKTKSATRNRTIVCLIDILKELVNSEEEEETKEK